MFPCALSLSLGSVCYLVISFHYVRCGKCVTCVLSTRYFVRPLRTLCSVILFIKFSGFTSFILFNIYFALVHLFCSLYSGFTHLFCSTSIFCLLHPLCSLPYLCYCVHSVNDVFSIHFIQYVVKVICAHNISCRHNVNRAHYVYHDFYVN